jgi:hypothetical protein
MNKLASLLIAAVPIVIIVGIFYVGKQLVSLQNCYEINSKLIDDAAYKRDAQSWDEFHLCQYKQQIITDLNTCVNNTKFSGQMGELFFKIGLNIIPLVRRDATEPSMLKQIHNSECSNYPTTLFDQTNL